MEVDIDVKLYLEVHVEVDGYAGGRGHELLNARRGTCDGAHA